jgi:hypothetical protein
VANSLSPAMRGVEHRNITGIEKVMFLRGVVNF